MSGFFNQGAVPIGSDAYVPRAFEDRVFEEVVAGRWVLLLGPRQHGKTTGFVRLRERLDDAGFLVASVDLQGLPANLTYPEILRWVASQLAATLGAPPPNVSSGQGEFLVWLAAITPAGKTPIVLFIDEAGGISDGPSRNAFYGQIRQMSNLRAESAPDEIPSRIRCVFAGTFRHEKLVHELNSPFNVCRLLDTEDLIMDQARVLAVNVEPRIADFVKPVFDLVGGQPYLLQTILERMPVEYTATVDQVMAKLRPELPDLVGTHLESLFGKITSDSNLSSKVARMVREGSTDLTPADSDCTFLRVLGIAKREGTKLIFRNLLYREVAEKILI